MAAKIFRIIGASLVVTSAPISTAQVAVNKTGEVIIASDGSLRSPWIERRVCDEGRCYVLVFNRSTREVARIDGRLTTPFKATGTGNEIVRSYDKRR